MQSRSSLEAQVVFDSILNMNSLSLNEYRCRCGKLLLKGIFFNGTLEIKCKKCGEINKIGNTKNIEDDTHYLIIIDQGNGIIANINNVGCNILGYQKEELIGKHFTLINSSFPDGLIEKIFGANSVLNKENYFRIDAVHKTKGGVDIGVILNLKLFEPSEKEKYVLSYVEVKNYKGHEPEEVSFMKDASKFLINACDFYFDIDKDGIGEYISPKVQETLGFSQDQVIGKSYFDFIPKERREKDKKIFEYFSHYKQPYRETHDIMITSSGKTIRADLYFTSRFNDSGKFLGYRVLGWKEKPKPEKVLDG